MATPRGHRQPTHAASHAEYWLFAALVAGCGVDERKVETVGSERCAAASCPEAMAQGANRTQVLPGSSGLAPDAGPSDEAAPSVTSLGDGVACLSESRGMGLLPSALYLMLDSSGSMEEATGAGVTKWAAVQRAIRAFLAETRASDLLLGMQFFPLLVPGSSFNCMSHADCGPEGGPCFLSTCLQGSDITLCETDADCGSMPQTNPCVAFGLCAGSDPNAPLACVLPSSCGNGLGACEDFPRTCTNATSCDPERYGTPAVEIGSVSLTFTAIDQALTAQLPQGLTPTVPALRGSLEHARDWASTHPDQTVAIVLATDGLPTACGPSQSLSPLAAPIDQVLAIAADGVAGVLPIRTHVIGVFQPNDSASINNVNAIARAGGTEKAALIDGSGAVEQEFLAALRTVRDAAAPCVFDLEHAMGLDFSRVSLQFDAGGGATNSLPYVQGLLGCAATPEGWYYDTPPERGEPLSVQLCPNLCQLVRAAPTAGLQLEIGCAE
jgi:hypothetical protein